MKKFINCEMCGCVIVAYSKNKKFCTKCERKRRKTRYKKEEYPEETQKAAPRLTIGEIAKMQEEYQKRTGQYVSYGKMVSMIDQAKIRR